MSDSNFCNFFLGLYVCLVAWSPYWEHIKEGWAHRQEPNVLFMFYEEMNQVSFFSIIDHKSFATYFFIETNRCENICNFLRRNMLKM